MDPFTRLIQEHADAQWYMELSLFALLHEGLLTGLYTNEEPGFMWVEIAQTEGIFDPELAGYVTTKMMTHLKPMGTWEEAVAMSTTFYKDTVDLAPWVRNRWHDFADPKWRENHVSDWYAAHGVPSLLLRMPMEGDYVAAFSEFLRTVEAVYRNRDPNSGFWWLISDSIPDAILARKLAVERHTAALDRVHALRTAIR